MNINSVPDLLNDYRNHLTALARSEKTISWYLDILKRYFSFNKQGDSFRPIEKMGKSELTNYALHLQSTLKWADNPRISTKQGNLSPFTIQGHVRAVKAFWRWLYDQEYIDNNPLAKYPLPKVPRNIVPTLSIQSIKSLLGSIDRYSHVGARNYCILLLLIDTGMRVSEVARILLADMDLPKCLVKITGKGRKERVISISRNVRKELLRYHSNHHPSLCTTGSPYLFPSKYGNHVSINSIQQAIKRLADKAGLQTTKCNPHIFRHTFATMFIGKGGNSIVLKDIMGHESVQTTQKYVHFQPEDLQKQQWKFSPVADLFGK